jgi:hypothetical protein
MSKGFAPLGFKGSTQGKWRSEILRFGKSVDDFFFASRARQVLTSLSALKLGEFL